MPVTEWHRPTDAERREVACHMMAQLYDMPDAVRELLLVPTSPTVH
jgi:hypothetical protein